ERFGPLSVVAVPVLVCARASEASRSTAGKYDERTVPRFASARRASSHVVRVAGLFERARSMICASSSGTPAGGNTRSIGGGAVGGIAFAAGVHVADGETGVPAPCETGSATLPML